MRIVILGLSITSSWGNGHATCYRGLVRELSAQGHDVLFLERDALWYATHRDLPRPPYGRTALYNSVDELTDKWAASVRDADAVIVGSYVPEGIRVGEWVTQTAQNVTAFYDIDTPVTLAALERGDCAYLSRPLISKYDVYLSFTGGPLLTHLVQDWGAKRARPLYCAFDPELYFPDADAAKRYDLGYMGTYSPDRQPKVDAFLMEPAHHLPDTLFAVVGPQYPWDIVWPANVERIEHLPPFEHRAFYTAQRYTLNVTRADMIRAGYSPSVRLFEAAACATPIISDWWEGLDTFFEPNREILVAQDTDVVLRFLRDLPETERQAIGERARAKAVAYHTAARRAEELVGYMEEIRKGNE